MISEDSARRIAEALERLAAAIEAHARHATEPTPPGRAPLTFDLNRCAYCGGLHHGGLPCPLLAPTVSAL